MNNHKKLSLAKKVGSAVVSVQVNALGIGTICVEQEIDGRTSTVALKEVGYVPDLAQT